MNPVNRRAVLLSTGAAAAALALRRSLFAFSGSLAAVSRRAHAGPQARTRWIDQRHARRRHQRLPQHSVWRRYRAGALPGAAAAHAVERFEGVRRVHDSCAATHDAARDAGREFRAQPGIRWHAARRNRAARRARGRRRERGLPAPERFHAGVARSSQAPGAGLFSRRRLQQRLGQQPALRRQAAVQARRRGGGYGQSSAQRIRVSISRRHRPQAVSRFRQRRHARPGAGAQMGTRKHCRVRRRPFPGFDFWAIWGRGQVRHADGHARGARPVSSRDDYEWAAGERRVDRHRIEAHRSDAGQARRHASQISRT